MATSQQDYGELMAADIWADTTQQSLVVTGTDGVKRFLNFIVHGGTAEITDTFYDTIDRMNGSALTMYSRLADGTLEYSTNLPSFGEGTTSDSIVDQPKGSIAVYAVNGADFSGAAGGYAYVLYGPGCRSETSGPDVSLTPAWILATLDTVTGNITSVESNTTTEVASTVTSDGSPANPYAPIGVNWSISSATNTTIIAAASGGPVGPSYPLVDQIAHDDSVLAAQAFLQAKMNAMTTVNAYLSQTFPQTDFPENYSCSYSWTNSSTGATATTNVTGRWTYRSFALPSPQDSFAVMGYSAAQYKLVRINVASQVVTDLTPSALSQTFSDSDIQFEAVTDYSGFNPTITGKFAAPAGVYRNSFNACTSSILAYGNQAWWGHASPSKYPAALDEMGPISGAVSAAPAIQYQAVTFPTSSITFSGVPIVDHALAGHHPPLEGFSYLYEVLASGSSLAISNTRHLVSYAHPRRLPSQNSSVFFWAWTTDQDSGAGVDPLATVPDNAYMGDRYTMVSGAISVDTPFLFTNTQRGVTVVVPTEEAPDPAPSATQFIVPVRDGSGLSKDWRWFKNMAGANPFYVLPTGVIHLYLVDPVLGLWNYLGPAKESTGAAGNFGTDTGASGPYLTSQRTSKLVNLGGVLACTSVFGEMSPTLTNTLRSEQAGSSASGAYPPSTLPNVGNTEELWLVCSNDGTNWVKVQKLTERYADLAAEKKGDALSLKAGTTKLIGYGPRQCPIASAPCLIRKPIA